MRLNGEIHVPIGSSVLFSVNGNITVDESVGGTYNVTTPHLEGYFSADGSFDTGGNSTDCTVGADKRLNIAGSVVVNAAQAGGSFTNNRDMCEFNLQCPSSYVEDRPDFVLNAPDFIKHPNFIWHEVAP